MILRKCKIQKHVFSKSFYGDLLRFCMMEVMYTLKIYLNVVHAEYKFII